jgi:hypothetical protein
VRTNGLQGTRLAFSATHIGWDRPGSCGVLTGAPAGGLIVLTHSFGMMELRLAFLPSACEVVYDAS